MDAHKTNNQATVGSSILMCNLDAEADSDRRLTWLHDTRGMRAQFIIIMLKLYTKAHKYHDYKIFYQLKLPSFFFNIKNHA